MTGPTTQGGPGRVSQTKPGSSYLPKPRLMFRPAQSVFNMLRVYLSHSIVIRKEPHKLFLNFISGQVTLLKDKANYLPHPSGFYHVQNSGSTTSIPLVDSYKVGLCKLPGTVKSSQSMDLIPVSWLPQTSCRLTPRRSTRRENI